MPRIPREYGFLSWVRLKRPIEKRGGVTKYNIPPVLNLLRDRLNLLVENLDAEPGLLHRRFAELDFASTGARRLKLRGATLLHVAAEYGNVDAVELLLDRRADVNTLATIDQFGVGGETPIFHAVTQFGGWGKNASGVQRILSEAQLLGSSKDENFFPITAQVNQKSA